MSDVISFIINILLFAAIAVYNIALIKQNHKIKKLSIFVLKTNALVVEQNMALRKALEEAQKRYE